MKDDLIERLGAVEKLLRWHMENDAGDVVEQAAQDLKAKDDEIAKLEYKADLLEGALRSDRMWLYQLRDKMSIEQAKIHANTSIDQALASLRARTALGGSNG